MQLVPVVPLLLFPFILIIFVIIFPVWAAGLVVLGLLLLIARALELVLTAVGLKQAAGLSTPVHKAFRWVLTFGGLADRYREAMARADEQR